MTLSDYLDEKNLTYKAFAKKAGIASAMNIYRYAAGKRVPRPEVAAKIVRATKGRVKLADIYGV